RCRWRSAGRWTTSRPSSADIRSGRVDGLPGAEHYPGMDYEYAPLRLPADVDRLTATAQLSIQAEFAGWELARIQLFRDGTRKVLLRRLIGPAPQPDLSY